MAAPDSFKRGLLDPDADAPAGLRDFARRPAVRRYDVYRNNVTSSLVDAVAAIFPAVQALVGTEYFRAMAREHIRATPPGSPLLHDYGHDFAAFIESFPPARNLPYLADVARLERLWLDSLNSADAEVFDHADLAAAATGPLEDLSLTAHPATRLFRSRYPAGDLFRANRGEPDLVIDPTGTTSVLVTRPGGRVLTHDLPPGGFTFFDTLFAGASLGASVERTVEAVPAFDPTAAITLLVQSGAALRPNP